MMKNDSGGVQIGAGDSYIRLARRGPVKSWGTTASIAVKAGPFHGEVEDDILTGVDTFCEQLDRLFEGLTGSATLTSCEKLELVFAGNGRGAISVAVELYGEHTPLSLLSFEFDIDQTYLPEIIKCLREEFPEG